MKKSTEKNTPYDRIYSAFEKCVDAKDEGIRYERKVAGKHYSFGFGTILENPFLKIVEAARVMNRTELNKKVTRLSGDEELLSNALGAVETYKINNLVWASGIHAEQGRENYTIVKVIEAIGSFQAARISLRCVVADIQGLRSEFESMLKELDGSPRGRSRIEAAREVAKRTAKLFSTITGERPTYSQNRDGLSGKFTPLLSEVFQILEINAVLKGPAEAAVASFVESDLNPPDRPIKLWDGS